MVLPACLAAAGLLGWGCGARTGLDDVPTSCSSDAQCDDGDPCTTDACAVPEGDTGTPHCAHQPAPAGTSCDDNNPCTSGDACTADGICVGTSNGTCLPPPVDTTCPAGCASGTPDLPAATPLVSPGLPASCSGGFEMNNAPEQVFTVTSLSPAGAQARTLDVEIATYKAPDHISITAVDASGTAALVGPVAIRARRACRAGHHAAHGARAGRGRGGRRRGRSEPAVTPEVGDLELGAASARDEERSCHGDPDAHPRSGRHRVILVGWSRGRQRARMAYAVAPSYRVEPGCCP